MFMQRIQLKCTGKEITVIDNCYKNIVIITFYTLGYNNFSFFSVDII